MADLKISQLTGATTPLAGTEVLPIVQSSTTKKVSIANVTSGRSVGVLDLTINDTNSGANYTQSRNGTTGFLKFYGSQSGFNGYTFSGVDGDLAELNNSGNFTFKGNLIPSVAAKGVNFTANTPAAGMTSQLLNWYEEGTWTPVLADASTGGNTGTADFTFARYTRIGRKVFFNVNFININTTGMTAGNTLFVRGLPFASNAYCNGFSNMASVANVTYAGTMIDAQVSAGSSNIRFYDVKSATAQTLLTVAALTSGSAYLYINGSYEV